MRIFSSFTQPRSQAVALPYSSKRVRLTRIKRELATITRKQETIGHHLADLQFEEARLQLERDRLQSGGGR